MSLVNGIKHVGLTIDSWVRKIQGGRPSLRDLNGRIEQAEQEVQKSAQHAEFAAEEIRRTRAIRDQNQIAGVIRHSLGIGYGDKSV